MESLKPIVPGCLAMIIKSFSGNTGTVKVGQCLGRVSGPGTQHNVGPRWEVDRPMITTRGVTIYHLGEDQLMRIDGHEPDEHDELTKVKDHEESG
jgi:hypothetical protein